MLDADQRQSRRALVIGLSLIESQGLRGVLKAEGINPVHQAEDAAEAAAVLASELVDVVFTPPAGPGFHFRDVFRLLQGRGPNRDAAVVLVGTALAQSDIVGAIKAGVRGVLNLPTRKEALRELLPKLDVSRRADAAESESPRRSRATAPRNRRNRGMP